MGTVEERQAGIALWVLGGLNLLVGLLVLPLALRVGAAVGPVLSVVAGAVLIALGFLVSRGLRPAIIAGIVLLTVVLIVELAALVGGAAGGQVLVRLVITAAVLVLLVRALRGRAFDGEALSDASVCRAEGERGHH